MAVTVTASGPLFDGRAADVVTAAIELGNAEVAQEAVDRIRRRFGSVFRRPTGRAASRVVADLSLPEHPRITHDGLVYGPWLEGTSGRNDRSRFRGYRTFRIVAQDLQSDAADIAGPVILDRVVAELS